MISEILHNAGVWFGDCRGPDDNNPHGYFENRLIFREMYRIFGRNFMSAPPVDDGRWPLVVERVLKEQNYPGGPWAVKHGALYAGIWTHCDPIFVCIHRPVDKIMKSIERSGFLRHFSGSMIEWLVRRQIDIMNDVGHFRIDSDLIVSGETQQMEKLSEYLGLSLSFDTVDERLWH